MAADRFQVSMERGRWRARILLKGDEDRTDEAVIEGLVQDATCNPGISRQNRLSIRPFYPYLPAMSDRPNFNMLASVSRNHSSSSFLSR